MISNRKFFKNIKEYARPCGACLAAGLIMTLLLEGMSRLSIIAPLRFLLDSPRWFFSCFAIASLTYMLTLFARRRVFAFFIVTAFWLTLGITNLVLMILRATPLTASDFAVALDALTLFPLYVGPVGILGIIAAFIFVPTVSAALWLRSPKFKVRPAKALVALALMCALTAFSVFAGSEPYGHKRSPGTAELYEEYGFALGFADSVFGGGMARPDGYSEKAVASALELSDFSPAYSGKAPNVVLLQLESFFDAERIEGVEYSRDPIPNFRRLRKEAFLSGRLGVPVVGGGTANTELEVLTGLDADLFGVGEYPYATYLTDTAFPSIAREFAEAGLTAHALHNHNGSFYDRNEVYSNLGFDTFTPIEYMRDAEKNLLGWAKDSCLTGEISDALASTEGRDFVFAVSVQGHGKYPTDFAEGEIKASGDIFEGSDDAEGAKGELEYYLTQLSECDSFLGELTESLRASGEPTLLIVYGDHLPALGLGDDDVEGSIYETEYLALAIGYESELESSSVDLESRTLGTLALSLSGVEANGILGLGGAYISGILTDGEYQSALELLAYDLLEGKGYSGDVPLEPSKLRLGVRDIKINGVKMIRSADSSLNSDAVIEVKCEGINEYSLLVVNGTLDRDTVRYGNILYISNIPNGDFTVEIAQYGDGALLGKSRPVIVKGKRTLLIETE